MSGISDRVKVAMKNRPAGFISELTRRLKDNIKDDTPVDTGRLRGGWRAKGTNSGIIEFWNNVDYASYNEDDHSTKSGFMSNNLRQRLVNAIAKDVQEDLE